MAHRKLTRSLLALLHGGVLLGALLVAGGIPGMGGTDYCMDHTAPGGSQCPPWGAPTR